ncbi:MAG: response regulator transcription factor [Verrucomicrobiota bacterium]|nr:response regulator transcription factor [Verrucomicrobiota bacterium]
MQNANNIRVLLLDDHPVVLSGIAAMISDAGDMEVVGEAASVRQAKEMFRCALPDVSVLDLILPDGNGADLIADLRAVAPDARFVILTARVAMGDIARGMAAGANGYLFKSAPCTELLRAIRIAAQGGIYVSPAVLRESERVPYGFHLTERELSVLRHIARGYSNRRIAQELEISDETAKSHTKNILLKLGVGSRGQAAAQCLKLGLLHTEEL